MSARSTSEMAEFALAASYAESYGGMEAELQDLVEICGGDPLSDDLERFALAHARADIDLTADSFVQRALTAPEDVPAAVGDMAPVGETALVEVPTPEGSLAVMPWGDAASGYYGLSVELRKPDGTRGTVCIAEVTTPVAARREEYPTTVHTFVANGRDEGMAVVDLDPNGAQMTHGEYADETLAQRDIISTSLPDERSSYAERIARQEGIDGR